MAVDWTGLISPLPGGKGVLPVPYRDRFTGKPVDSFVELLPCLNGGVCEVCGAGTIDRCLVCGAPQCCPVCCAATTRELRTQDSATKDGA